MRERRSAATKSKTQSIGGLRISFLGLLESRLAKRIDRIHPTRVVSQYHTHGQRLSPSRAGEKTFLTLFFAKSLSFVVTWEAC